MNQDFPGGPTIKTELPLQGWQVQSLVEGLRLCMFHGMVKKCFLKRKKKYFRQQILPASPLTSHGIELLKQSERENEISMLKMIADIRKGKKSMKERK